MAYGILDDAEAAKIHKVRRHACVFAGSHTHKSNNPTPPPPNKPKTLQLVQARKAKGSTIYSPSPVKKGGAGNGKKKAAAPPKKKKAKLDDDVPVDTGLAEAGDEGVGTLSFS